MSSAASVIASFAAATAYWQNNSIRLAAFASIYCFASKSLTSAARWHLYPSVSNFVISPKPIFPSFMDCQNSSTLSPIGVIAPIPVTTTRLLITFPFHFQAPNSGLSFLIRHNTMRSKCFYCLYAHTAVHGNYLSCDVGCFLRG